MGIREKGDAMMFTHRFAAVLLTAWMSGCAMQVPAPEPQGIDGVACAGAIEAPVDALTVVRDEALRARVIGASGQGGLCDAKVFEVTRPIRVYRIWDAARGTRLGVWWSLDHPAGSPEAYRAAFAICPEWSALDAAVACTLQQGARVVIGPGQSVRCAAVDYPRSAVNQVFVAAEPASVPAVFADCEDIPGLR